MHIILLDVLCPARVLRVPDVPGAAIQTLPLAACQAFLQFVLKLLVYPFGSCQVLLSYLIRH